MDRTLLERFTQHDHVGLYVIRPHIWHDGEIAEWYRQNAILLVARARLDELKMEAPHTLKPFSSARPIAFSSITQRLRAQIEEDQALIGSWKLFRPAVRARVRGD